MAKRLDRAGFEAQIQTAAGLSVIEFYSDSCVPCKRLSPLLAEIEEENPGIFIGKVNIGYEKELTQELEVTSTPTLLFYRDGALKERISGTVRRTKLEELIAEYQ